MKQLFETDYEIWSNKANDIERRLRPFIVQLLNELQDEGYALRPASFLMQELISVTTAEHLLRRNTKMYREKNPRPLFSEVKL